MACSNEYIDFVCSQLTSAGVVRARKMFDFFCIIMPRLLLLLFFLPFISLRASTPMTWRGLMLDSGRQYQTVECIEALLDSMATRGMNTFHWHLTENDGWRMDVRCAPRLTSVGAYVADGPEQQGFYTRREMKHIVRYARRRGITVVPEIDLPGHSAALISAYPEFGCSKDVVCPAHPELLPFLKRVLDEVCDIFPSPYIHLGGDEVNHTAWRECEACQRLMHEKGISDEASLQVWFERQLVEHLARHNRTAILWEDVLYETPAPLPSNLVVQMNTSMLL